MDKAEEEYKAALNTYAEAKIALAEAYKAWNIARRAHEGNDE